MKERRPSETARRVAAQRLGFSRPVVPDGDPEADDRLARDVAGDLADAPPGPMARYLAARTAFFDRTVIAALAGGIKQIVIVGAGYDGRALRYGKAGVRWYEIDHPVTQADKRSRLERLGIDADGLAFVSADLSSQPVGPALGGAGHDRDRPSLFVCEGLMVYLTGPAVGRLLTELRQEAAAGSSLAVSVSVASTDAERRQSFARRVAAVGEPALTVLEPAEAAPLLLETGWREEVGGSERERNAGLMVARPTSDAVGQPEAVG
jgi:methyltransferase (TIGR00027 family)